jgi:hypothetical protein
MTRQNLFSDVWDGDNEEAGTRRRVFWRPDNARMGATLYELAPRHVGEPRANALRSRRDVLRSQRPPSDPEPARQGDAGPRRLRLLPGRTGRAAHIRHPTEEPAEIPAISAGSFPDVVAYPEHGYAWVATPDPDPELLAKGGDPGIIARFEIPFQ